MGTNEPFPYSLQYVIFFINLGIDHVFSFKQKSCIKTLQSLSKDLATKSSSNGIKDNPSLEFYRSIMCDDIISYIYTITQIQTYSTKI